ncbi:MAG: FKBP-type peptidyl-prolyl cis-trans isomerase [Candidatus Gracilibacteria bacterium]|nr:FKBP-type peptidyl-prolyl cis-trans isomerase [Candidatus Gracilibacteria bacterium]
MTNPENKDNKSQLYIIIGVIGLILIIGGILVLNNKGTFSSDDKSSTEGKLVKNGDTIKVDYVGRLEDGTIFDASLEEFAKKSKNYSEGRKFEPLEFTVGAGQMIKGFDAGVVGMKVGEKKTLTIKPADGYGEKSIKQDIPLNYLQDKIVQTVPADSFKDKIVQTVPAEAFKDKQLKVGDVINESGITGKVTAISDLGVSVEIDNKQNPFYGKKLAVGLQSDYQGNGVKITAISGTGVSVEVDNKQNPFYGKKLAEGLVGKLPNGQDVKIVSIGKESVTVEMNNPSELAGKTLIFDVEVKSIK